MRYTNASLRRRNDGTLPTYAWPGGYPLYYVQRNIHTRGEFIVCPSCARATDGDPAYSDYDDYMIVAGEVNWGDVDLHCEACRDRIPSAYEKEQSKD